MSTRAGSTGSPSIGSNDGFIYEEQDGVFSGSERFQVNGLVSGTPVATNYRLSIDSNIPEPTTTALLIGAGLAVLGVARARRG